MKKNNNKNIKNKRQQISVRTSYIAPNFVFLLFFHLIIHSHERDLTDAVGRPRATLPQVPHREQHEELVERREPQVHVVGSLERGPQVIVVGKVFAAVKPQGSMPHQFVFPHDGIYDIDIVCLGSLVQYQADKALSLPLPLADIQPTPRRENSSPPRRDPTSGVPGEQHTGNPCVRPWVAVAFPFVTRGRDLAFASDTWSQMFCFTNSTKCVYEVRGTRHQILCDFGGRVPCFCFSYFFGRNGICFFFLES